MPTYEYQNDAGRRIEAFRQVAQRDHAPRPGYHRIISRTSCRIGDGTPDPSSADVAAPRGLKEMESQMGTARLEKEMGMPAKKLKQIWNL